MARTSNISTARPILAALGALALLAGILVPTAQVPAAASGCGLMPDGGGRLRVGNAADLAEVGTTCSLDGDFIQTADIVLPAGGGSNHRPIGDGLDPFTGTYDGAGYEIAGLRMRSEDSPGWLGLFGVVEDATLSGIHLVDVLIENTDGVRAGGLVGETRGSTRIEDSAVDGEIDGASGVGGLVGVADGDLDLVDVSFAGEVTGTIGGFTFGAGGLLGAIGEGPDDEDMYVVTVTGATVTGTVVGLAGVGGLVGLADEYTVIAISDAAVMADVSGERAVGGLLGAGWFGDSALSISGATVTGTVTGSGNLVGGLLGESYGDVTIEDAHVHAEVRGVGSVGGLIGYLYLEGAEGLLVDRSAVTGSVAGTGGDVGGLVGYLETDERPASIRYSYVNGEVSGGGQGVGGLVGHVEADEPVEIMDSYAIGAVGGAGATKVGRIVGSASVPGGSELELSRTYHSGSVAGAGELIGAVSDGAGDVAPTLTASFSSGGGTDLTDIRTFSVAGWAIVSGWVPFDAIDDVWGICDEENSGTPFLLWQYETDPCGSGDGDGNGGNGNVVQGGGSGSGVSATPVLTGGSVPSFPAGQGVWQQSDGTLRPLALSSPGARQLRYSAPGISVTFTGGPGTSIANGLVVSPNGTIECEVCTVLASGNVIEVWMFSAPRLLAAHRAGDVECQMFPIPLGAPLDGRGLVTSGAHTLQLALPTASGMQAVNVGVTVGSPVPVSVPAGEGSVPSGGVLFLLLGAAGALLAGRRLVTAG